MDKLDGFALAYRELNKKLIRTLVIKSETSADAINRYLRRTYGDSMIDDLNPGTWKYYMNIAGEYHSTDTKMMVTSLDTLTEIEFTRANLLIHTATLDGYQYDSRYYNQLVSRYPDQEQLILGVLYPVDKQRAIDEEDGAILGYPRDLVEPQELTLIRDLEVYIKNHILRWYVKAYSHSDNLYQAAYHGVLYASLLPRLLNLRLLRCKTDEAHSFHIRQYLASHGQLDRFFPFMTLKQALFLYRNINYIERNAGKVSQFTKLIDKLLTDRGIPIAEYSIRHLTGFDTQYYPEAVARTKGLNPRTNVPEQIYREIETLFKKEEPLAYGNPLYYRNNTENDILAIKNHNSSVFQTKDLESAMVDYSDAVPNTLESVLINHWAYMSNVGLYTSYINFKNPVTGEVMTLRALDAFIYMYYLELMSVGIEIEEVPMFLTMKRRKHPRPTVDDLLSVVEETPRLRKVAENLLAQQPIYYPTPSTSSFFNFAYGQYEEMLRHWYIVSNTHDLYDRASIQNMIYQLYVDELITFNVPYATIDQWLVANNLPLYDYSYQEAHELIKSIYEASTGMTVDQTKIMRNIQKAMIDMMKQLVSYSVQFIREINSSKIIPINWPGTRVSLIGSSAEMTADIPIGIRVVDRREKAYGSVDVPVSEVNLKEIELHSKTQPLNVRTATTTLLNVRYREIIQSRFDAPRMTVKIQELNP